jgi:type IV fimbrial biogenesis protein FimT
MLGDKEGRIMLKPMRICRGFTLIELMIGLALLGILLAFAMPGFTVFLQNQTLRAQAESILAGLQTARGEALRRNTAVSFFLTSDSPSAAMTAVNVTAGGPNWLVAVVPAVAGVPFTLIDSQVGAEGGSEQSVNIGASAATGVIFGPLGETNLAAPLVIALTPAVGNCAAAGGVRCLTVEVAPTGQILLCDPSITAVGDTRRCPSTP